MNQSGRMDNVRDALLHFRANSQHVRLADAALAEVEEWEAYVGSQDWYTEWYAPMRARAEAAEDEADRLKAALKDNNVWLTAMLASSAVREPYVRGAEARRELNEAALVPADRNTT